MDLNKNNNEITFNILKEIFNELDTSTSLLNKKELKFQEYRELREFSVWCKEEEDIIYSCKLGEKEPRIFGVFKLLDYKFDIPYELFSFDELIINEKKIMNLENYLFFENAYYYIVLHTEKLLLKEVSILFKSIEKFIDKNNNTILKWEISEITFPTNNNNDNTSEENIYISRGDDYILEDEFEPLEPTVFKLSSYLNIESKIQKRCYRKNKIKKFDIKKFNNYYKENNISSKKNYKKVFYKKKIFFFFKRAKYDYNLNKNNFEYNLANLILNKNNINIYIKNYIAFRFIKRFGMTLFDNLIFQPKFNNKEIVNYTIFKKDILELPKFIINLSIFKNKNFIPVLYFYNFSVKNNNYINPTNFDFKSVGALEFLILKGRKDNVIIWI